MCVCTRRRLLVRRARFARPRSRRSSEGSTEPLAFDGFRPVGWRRIHEKAVSAVSGLTLRARFITHAIVVMASLSALSSRVAHQARFRSRASCRVTASRGVRASALPQKGRPALTMVVRVPSEKESEVDALFASHEAMMRDTHIIGEAEADDIGHPRMLEYYVAKSTELSDPLDPGTSREPLPARPPRAATNNAAFRAPRRRLTCSELFDVHNICAVSRKTRSDAFSFLFIRQTTLSPTQLTPGHLLHRLATQPLPPPATCYTR